MTAAPDLGLDYDVTGDSWDLGDLVGEREVTEKQYDFLTCGARFRGFVGGRGSGKTYAGMDAALIEAGARRCTGMILAPTYTMVADVILPVFEQQAEGIIRSLNRSDMVAILCNGSRIMFRSADRPDRVRGPSTSWLWADEAAQMEETLWLIAIATLREFGRMGRAWLTTTPRGKDWIFRRFVLDENPDYRLIHAKTTDNTFVDDDFQRVMHDNYGVGWYGRQELEGEFCDPEGALFHREWFKIEEEAPDFVDVVRGYDLATTTKTTSDYTVGAKVGLTEDGHYWILDVVRGKWEWPDTEEVIVATALGDGPLVTMQIESVAFQAAATQSLHRRRELAPFAINEWRSQRDKLSNALPWASKAKAGRVHLLAGAWNSAFLDEVCAFDPSSKKGHDDQVDAVSIAYHSVSEPQPCVTVI